MTRFVVMGHIYVLLILTSIPYFCLYEMIFHLVNLQSELIVLSSKSLFLFLANIDNCE